MRKLFYIFLITSIAFAIACEKEEGNEAPSCLLNLGSGVDAGAIQGDTVTITVLASDSDGKITDVSIYINDSLVSSKNGIPYKYLWATATFEPREYSIKAIATDDAGASEQDELKYTIHGSAPVISFGSDQKSVFIGTSIQFTDSSLYEPSSWIWSFGDGKQSTEQNPEHTYTYPGVYSVKLIASNDYGENAVTKNNLITVIERTVSDIDRNIYKVVIIGEQAWMAENLRVTHYADGTEITLVDSNSVWGNLGLEDKAWCYYDNSSSNFYTYGALYTGAAAMYGQEGSNNNPSGVQGVCPDGWHLPSEKEWNELELYLGLSESQLSQYGFRGTDEGDKLKATSGWNDNGNGNNSSGFTAVPAGARGYTDGAFFNLGIGTHFWSATEPEFPYFLFRRSLFKNDAQIYRNDFNTKFGLSVRCIKD